MRIALWFWLSSHQLQRITFDLDFSSHLLVSTRYQHWIPLGAMDYVTGESRLVTGHNRWCHQTERHSGWAGVHVPVTREYANGPIWSHRCHITKNPRRTSYDLTNLCFLDENVTTTLFVDEKRASHSHESLRLVTCGYRVHFLFTLFSFFTPLLRSFSLVFAIVPSHVWVLCSYCVLQIFRVHFPLALLRFSYGMLSLHFDEKLAL